MKCVNCGSDVKEGAKFCRECGNEIVMQTEALTEKICSKCGNTIERDALFCNECGFRVDESNTTSLDENKKPCPHCGNMLNKDALFCGECGNALTQSIKQKELPKSAKKKKDKGLIFLIVLLVVVLLASAGVVGYVYYQNRSIDIDMPNIEEQNKTKNDSLDNESSTEEPQNEDEETDAGIPSEEPQTIVPNVSNEVSYIRDVYNDIQSNLSNLKQVKDGNVIKYYNGDDLVRLDVPSGLYDSYTRYYYYDNNKLIFEFCFDGEKENRLYFKDYTLFRWIDEDGVTHDNELDNTDLINIRKKNIDIMEEYYEV